MNNLIERYIHDVVRRLKEDQRDEVAKELRSNIDEMLSDHPTEAETINVLKELGHPRVLANNYRGEKRYLVGPEWFDDYLLVLKIVAIVFAAIALVSGLITHALNPESERAIGIIFEVFFGTIGNMIDAVLSAFAVVTIIFICIDRYAKKDSKELEFDVKTLPQLPDNKSRDISRVGTIIEIVVGTVLGFVFLYLLYNNQLLIGWFEAGELNTSLPVFTYDVVMGFFGLLVFSVVINVGSDIYKLTQGQWTISVTAIHSVVKLFSGIIAIIFLNAENLINPAFIDQVSETIDISAASITNGLHIAFIVLSVLIALGTLTEITTAWRKTLKYRFKNN